MAGRYCRVERLAPAARDAHLRSYRAWLAGTWSARGAIVVADVWKTTSFAGLLVLAGLQSIPGTLYEAAAVKTKQIPMIVLGKRSGNRAAYLISNVIIPAC